MMAIQLDAFSDPYGGPGFTAAYARVVMVVDDIRAKRCHIEVDIYRNKAARDAEAKPAEMRTFGIVDIPAVVEVSHLATQAEVDAGDAVVVGDKVIDTAAVAADNQYTDNFADESVRASGKTLVKAAYNHLNGIAAYAGREV